MEILTVMGIVALYGLMLVLCVDEKAMPTSEKLPTAIKIAQLNTLLQNVEAYDGTSKGQKKIGGDSR